MSASPARLILRRCDELARVTDEPGRLTRTFASPAMRRANELVGGWIREAGMKTRTDTIGNLIGHYDGDEPNAKILLLGSHLDTVPNAGKFDGPLGVILAIACVEQLYRDRIRLPFAIEVVGFADEEGERYQTAYLGSKVLAGCFDERDLRRKDADGVSMANAINRFGGNPAKMKSARLNPKNLLGYVEVHIEQGPVLEHRNLVVGVVTAIAGQSRFKISFAGRAGHAGTVPMDLRRDALCAAAEFIVAAEKFARKTNGLVATVGQIHAEPGASNVIPGLVTLTLDVRHRKDSVRLASCAGLQKIAGRIAGTRKTKVAWQVIQQTASVPCSPELSVRLKQAVKKFQRVVATLPSGAGHDAAVMAQITPAAMLFVRCKGGVSHQPDESVSDRDVSVAFEVMNDFLRQLAGDYA
ncbi:MAG: allantoate amidohydrolase [Limisphaerales bacterium]